MQHSPYSIPILFESSIFISRLKEQTMIHNDLYGFCDTNLEQVREAIEEALDVKFQARESAFWGEYYYEYPSNPKHGILHLQANSYPLDDEPAEREFPEFQIILYAENTPSPFALE